MREGKKKIKASMVGGGSEDNIITSAVHSSFAWKSSFKSSVLRPRAQPCWAAVSQHKPVLGGSTTKPEPQRKARPGWGVISVVVN